MGQFSKNIMKALARKASTPGGISQTQEQINDGFLKSADWLAKLLAAGYALQSSRDPADQTLLEKLIAGSKAWQQKAANVLLENDGRAVSGLLRIITNPNTL